MLIPKKNRVAMYSYLFKEGAMVVKKDAALAKHPDMEVPNIQAMKLGLSLTSKGFVNEKFVWQYYYYTLTDEGIEYLRSYLNIPADTVPDTLKKSDKPQGKPSFGAEQDSRGGDRGEYRAGGRGGFRGRRGGGAGDRSGDRR